MGNEARILLDMATLATVDGEWVRARKLREASAYITFLEGRIISLEDGECRFNCRVKSDMWKEGFRWGFVRAHKLSPADDDVEYKKWRTQYENDNPKSG